MNTILTEEKIIVDEKIDFCAKRIISLQPDFLGETSLLEEIAKGGTGHQIIFYPKFHCELNYIGRYRRAAKRYA